MNLDYLTASRYFKMYCWFKETYDQTTSFEESISPNQLYSKIWLIEELKKIYDKNHALNVEIVGSWYGWPLVGMLIDSFNIENIKLYDIDKECCRIANLYANLFDSKHLIKTYNMNYWKDFNKSKADLIINCSSEHMVETFFQQKNRYPLNPIFVIQSNNMIDEKTHINCCKNVEELIEKNKISNVLYSGEKNFNDMTEIGKHKRFMVIGSF